MEALHGRASLVCWTLDETNWPKMSCLVGLLSIFIRTHNSWGRKYYVASRIYLTMESFPCPFLSFQWRSSTSKGLTSHQSHFGKLRIGPKRLSIAFWTQGNAQATVPRVATLPVASFMISCEQSKSISFLLHSNGCHGVGVCFRRVLWQGSYTPLFCRGEQGEYTL